MSTHDDGRPRRRRVTVAQQTAQRLRSELAGGRWAEGDKLPSEAALADELGVGRSSAREAVQSLAREGLLDVRHGTGIFAARPPQAAGPRLSVADALRRARIVEVYEVRRAIEVEAARLAAVRIEAAELAAIGALLDDRQHLVGADTAAFVRADLRFHHAVVTAARNRLLLELFEQLHDPLSAAITELVDDEPTLPDTREDHSRLLHALRAADPDAAAHATVVHFDAIIRLLRGPDAPVAGG